MQAYGREFKFSHLMKMASTFGSAFSPLLLRALTKGPLAAFEYSCQAAEAYDQVVGGNSIPLTHVSELGLAGDQKIWIDLSQPSSEMTVGELAQLCGLVKWRNPQVVVEIGTYKGVTTMHLSRNSADTCRIFTVDLPPEMADKSSSKFSDPQLVQSALRTKRVFGSDPKITQILQDSTTVQWERLLDRPIDFALVDASHFYEHVRKDTEAIAKVLAPDGMVVWHDYRIVEIRRGVRRYLDELSNEGIPVKRISGTSFCVYQQFQATKELRAFAA